MTTTSDSAFRPRGFGRVVSYYLALGLLATLGVLYVPIVRSALSGGRLLGLGEGDVGQLLDGTVPPPVGPAVEIEPWTGAVFAAISMVGALIIMVPVTWIYMITRHRRGFDESVLHTLLILPVAVTGIVMIVQDSIALAFSLAGIVAAVRFRTTLEDTKDAVYVFLAIGVGLASGVQALGIALALSVVFNGVVVALWATRFGNVYARSAGRGGGGMSVGDVSAGPGSGLTALQVGDPAVLEAARARDLEAIAERAVRAERHISEERTKKKSKRANAMIFVHAPQAETAQAYVDGVLDELATRYRLVEVGPGPRGVLLEYLARLDGAGVQGGVMDRLREGHGGAIIAAELRSLKGLKPRT